MIPGPLDAHEITNLVAVARGDRAADLAIINGRVVNVYSQEVERGDVLIAEGRIARVDDSGGGASAVDVIDADGAYVLPTYLEPHAHPWALFTPDTLARHTLPWGNVGFVAELLNLQTVLASGDLLQIFEELQQAPVRWYWAVRVAGQSGQEPDELMPMEELTPLLEHSATLQTAEITQWPRVLAGDPQFIGRIAEARARGLRIDAHSAGAGARKIPQLAAAGFTADHEAIDLDEARAALRSGFHVLLRNSSLRPDLDRLMPIVLETDAWARLSVTSDGSGPAWISENGMIDGIVRQLIVGGVPVPRAVALASLNPAVYLGLDHDLGGLAPGRAADVQVLTDFDGRPPEVVVVGGVPVARQGELTADWPAPRWSAHDYGHDALPIDLLANRETYISRAVPGETVPVMRFVSAAITRAERARTDHAGRVPDALHIVHLSWDGRWRAEGWARGLAPRLEGLASSYTTSGGFLVMGTDPAAMARAAGAAFSRERGGIAVIEGGRLVAQLTLDVAHSMSSMPMEEIVARWQLVEAATRRAGYGFDELLFCLCFMTADFLPDLRLVERGLLHVKSGEIVVPATPARSPKAITDHT